MHFKDEALLRDEIDVIIRNAALRRAHQERSVEELQLQHKSTRQATKQLKTFDKSLQRLRAYRARFDVDPTIPRNKLQDSRVGSSMNNHGVLPHDLSK